MEYLLALVVTVFIALVVLGLFYWGGHQLAGAFGIPQPLITIFDVFLVLIGAIILIALLVGAIHPIAIPHS